jgi:hypothetical protein
LLCVTYRGTCVGRAKKRSCVGGNGGILAPQFLAQNKVVLH